MIIAVRPQPLCALALEPIKAEDRRIVSQSNQYDGSCIAYLIDSQDVESFVSSLSDKDREEIENGYQVQVDIDAWEFRHMVGGQSD